MWISPSIQPMPLTMNCRIGLTMLTDQKVAWYRHRAEEEGQRVILRLTDFMLFRNKFSGAYAEKHRSSAVTYDMAREAAHYANLVLGPVEIVHGVKNDYAVSSQTPEA